MTTKTYTKTITPTTTPDGRDGFLITCDCETHNGTSGAAILAFPTTKARVHGWVTQAHHPARVMRQHNAAKGVWAV